MATPAMPRRRPSYRLPDEVRELDETLTPRAIDIIEIHGPERVCVASACDWGERHPVAVAEFVIEMRRRGHGDALIRKIVYENPIEFLSQSPKFALPDREGAVAAQ